MTNDLVELANRVENGDGADNALDVLCEVAMFEPDEIYRAVRANAAGTKVIYTRHDGTERAYWADAAWTMNRAETAEDLRLLALSNSPEEKE